MATFLTQEQAGTATLSANGDILEFDMPAINSWGGMAAQFIGIGTLTVTAEASNDGGTTWVSLNFWDNQLSGRQTTTKTTNGFVFVDLTGIRRFRWRVSAYTSGTVGIGWAFHENPSPSHAIGSTIDNIAGITPGTAAASLGKAEDAASVSADTGVFSLSIRRSTISASPTNATGDYQEIVTGDDGQLGCRVVPSTVTGNMTTSFTVAAASTNATSTKASAGNVYRINIASVRATVCFVKFYNKASAPTVGTDTPVLVVAAGPTQNTTLDLSTNPFYFSTGIAWATTTGLANSDSTAVALSDVALTLVYA